MNEQFYIELDPERRWKILQEEPDSEEKRRAQELYLLRHRDEKSGERSTEQDHYLWFLLTLGISGSRKPFFVKPEAGRVLRELRKIAGIKEKTDQDGLHEDTLFHLEMKNAAARLFSVNGQEGGGRKLFGVGNSGKEMRLADQCADAWRLIYGAPMYLNLVEELRPVSEAVKEAYLEVDELAGERLAALDQQKRGRRAEK